MEELKQELLYIEKLKEAMEIGLKREVFLPEVVRVKYYIKHHAEFKKLNKSDFSGPLPDFVKHELQKIALADDEMVNSPYAAIAYREIARSILRITEGNGH